MIVKSESEVAQLCGLLATPWTAAYQALPSMGFSRQEYWSGVPLPSPQLLEWIPKAEFSREIVSIISSEGKGAGWGNLYTVG